MTARRGWRTVLTYSAAQASRSVVRRQYALYRRELGLPPRCDNPECIFHTNPLQWNGELLPSILDHKSGVRQDNRPKNLQYLCPNCDSQRPTRGGFNKGRVRDLSAGGYLVAERDGRRAYTLIAEPGAFQLKGHAATLTIGKALKPTD